MTTQHLPTRADQLPVAETVEDLEFFGTVGGRMHRLRKGGFQSYVNDETARRVEAGVAPFLDFVSSINVSGLADKAGVVSYETMAAVAEPASGNERVAIKRLFEAGGAMPFRSCAEAVATAIPAPVKRLNTQFYDPNYVVPSTLTGGANYKRCLQEPDHPLKFRSSDRFTAAGDFDNDNGGWWEIDEDRISVKMTGATGGNAVRDTAAINAALAYWSMHDDCTLFFPVGWYFYDGSTVIDGLKDDGTWTKNNKIIMEGKIKHVDPGATTGNPIAWEMCHFENLTLDLRVWGGGKMGDFSLRSPNDGGTTFLQLHAILWAKIDIESMDYLGRTLHTTTKEAGNAKHVRNIDLSLVTGNRPDTPPSDTARATNGQPLFADNTLSEAQYGSWGRFKWRGEGSYYGPTFENMTDVSATDLEWGKVSRGPGLELRGCNLFQLDKMYPTEMSYGYPALQLCSSEERDTYRVAIGYFHCDISGLGIHYSSDNVQGNTYHEGLSIQKLESNVMSVGVVQIEDVLHPISINDITAGYTPNVVTATGACGRIKLDFVRTRSITNDAVKINGSVSGLFINGRLSDVPAGYSVIDLGSVETNYVELHLDLIDINNCDQAIKLPGAANKVRMIGGRVLGTAPKFNSTLRPEYVEGVLGVKTYMCNLGTIANGQTSVTVTHYLTLMPQIVTVTGRHAETGAIVVTNITSTEITFAVPAAVTADRTFYWEARAVISRGDLNA